MDDLKTQRTSPQRPNSQRVNPQKTNLQKMDSQKTNQQKADSQKNIKKSKPKRSGAGKIIFFIILFIMVLSLALCYVFNVGGIKARVSSWINPGSGQADVQTSDVQDSEKLFELQQAQIEQKKEELDQKESELTAKENELVAREEDLKAKIDKLTTDQSTFENKKQDVESIAKIYENMEPDAAAKILGQYQDKNEVANIVKQFSEEKAAEILSQMNASDASVLLHMINQDNNNKIGG